ncbi:MAG: hypothetical protein ACR2MK_12090 [Solirubrobacteraceae bacterium]
MTAPRLLLLTLLIATTAALLAACGPTPPQAPLADAKVLDASLSGISTACGEIYQMSAFAPPPARELDPIEASASFEARKLARVYAKDPAWIYQGETVRTIVGEALSTLRGCGLDRPAAVLKERTRGARPSS